MTHPKKTTTRNSSRRRIVAGLALWVARMALWVATKQGIPGAAEAGDFLKGKTK